MGGLSIAEIKDGQVSFRDSESADFDPSAHHQGVFLREVFAPKKIMKCAYLKNTKTLTTQLE